MNINYGYVYCLTNTCMPGICKIGQTVEKTSQERADQLSSTTSCPVSFEVVYYICVRDPLKYEKIIHDKLKNIRINKRREFFRGEPYELIKFFKKENLISNNKCLDDFPKQYLTICKLDNIDLNIFNKGEIASIDSIEIDYKESNTKIIKTTEPIVKINNYNDTIKDNNKNLIIKKQENKKLKYCCSYCPYKSNKKHNMIAHLKRDDPCNEKNNKQYTYFRDLDIYICKLCKYMTSNYNTVIKHLSKICKVKKERKQIEECNKKQEEIDRVEKELEVKKLELQNMKNDIIPISNTTNNSNSNNNDNTINGNNNSINNGIINQNFFIVKFNKEDISKLTKKDEKNIMEKML